MAEHINSMLIAAIEDDEFIWTQLQSESGEWYDRTGYQTVDAAFNGKRWEESRGARCRVVAKVLRILER